MSIDRVATMRFARVRPPSSWPATLKICAYPQPMLMPNPRLPDDFGSMPAAFSWSRAQTIHGVESSATLLRSRWPPPIVHQPSDASPTTLAPTLLDCLHTDDVKRYFTDSFMPFCAASVMSCEQGVPAVIEMNTSGFVAARLVMGSVALGACASIASVTYSIWSFFGDWAKKALNVVL